MNKYLFFTLISIGCVLLACKKTELEPWDGYNIYGSASEDLCSNGVMDFEDGERGVDCGENCQTCTKDAFSCTELNGTTSGLELKVDGFSESIGLITTSVKNGFRHVLVPVSGDTLRFIFGETYPTGYQTYRAEGNGGYNDGQVDAGKVQMTYEMYPNNLIFHATSSQEIYVYYDKDVNGLDRLRMEFCQVTAVEASTGNQFDRILSGTLYVKI